MTSDSCNISTSLPTRNGTQAEKMSDWNCGEAAAPCAFDGTTSLLSKSLADHCPYVFSDEASTSVRAGMQPFSGAKEICACEDPTTRSQVVALTLCGTFFGMVKPSTTAM